MNLRLSAAAIAVAAVFSAPLARADVHSNAALAPVVVTATRAEQASFDVPGAVDVISASQIRDGQPGVNLSESLWRAPGTVVLNRQNYAQDLQVSMRGFGARSAFGTRSIRLMQDGIPLTMPDGQGQTGTFDLANAQRIEVLRGPFSAAYGNQSGGVIQLFTADGPATPTAGGRMSFGSFGTTTSGMQAGGQVGSINYTADANEFRTDGFRQHSAAARDTATARMKLALNETTSLSVLGNWLRQNGTQDPQGLTQAMVNADPTQVSANTLKYNTRKDIHFIQGGAVLDHRLGNGDEIHFAAYSGTRSVTQFQSTPSTSQSSATSPGGVVAYSRDFDGVGGRWTHKGSAWRLTAGVDYEAMQEARKGYLNFLGTSASPTAFGVMGALRRDEDNRVSSVNSYAEGEWKFAKDWSLTGGVRNTRVQFGSADHYFGDGVNGSGGLSFQNTSPMAGVLWQLSPAVNLFANFGRGFETPTFTEMAYQPGANTSSVGAGLNLALRPSKSRSMEAGVKAFITENARLELTLFDVATSDEIVVSYSTNGKTVYTNAGRTGRQGIELSWNADLGRGFTAAVAWTQMKAQYKDAFASSSGTVPAGNTIAGLPTSTLHGELAWSHPASGFTGALEGHHVGSIQANDVNTAAAPAYDVASARMELKQAAGHWVTREFLRCDNLTNRRYIGSVIVNDANGQYFEPAPGRNWTLGATASYRF